MQPPTEPVTQPEWPVPDDAPAANSVVWLARAQRFSFVRAHISLFATGSVVLLSANLLIGSGEIWADRWISAWALIVIMHAIIAGIATLALQLMVEDDVRPASEVRWEPLQSWTGAGSSPPPPSGPPSVASGTSTPAPDPWHRGPDDSGDEERVSWQAASDAAWLTDTRTNDDDTVSESDQQHDEH